MKVVCLQENLAKGLSIVGRAVASRSTLPILSNVKLETDGDRLKLSATDLEISINCWVGAKIEEEGSITVPARLLGEFVNSLPPERIDLHLDRETQTLNLKCARFESNIKGIDALEFPPIPTVSETDDLIKLEPELLRTMISQVVFAAATDESRPIYTGVHVQFHENDLTMAATDGFRLSVKSTTLEQGFGTSADVIVPARTLNELSRIAGGQEQLIEVSIPPDHRQIIFRLEDVEIASQLIEGEFANSTKIVDEARAFNTRSVLDTTSFLKAVRVSHLFARDTNNGVTLEIAPAGDELMNGRVTFIATSPELGDNVVDVDASIEGESVEISFNAKYLIDLLSMVDSPQVVLETRNPDENPGVFRMVGDEKFTHIIMPMRLPR
ncbi:MAG: DNA polymerase III subunit beta [Anaerolineae bacterium]|nr:DNA polymerase III subunit beta [Anaerolineae bacterium]